MLGIIMGASMTRSTAGIAVSGLNRYQPSDLAFGMREGGGGEWQVPTGHTPPPTAVVCCVENNRRTMWPPV